MVVATRQGVRLTLPELEVAGIMGTMSTQKTTFSDQIRRAVKESELSCYRICQEISIVESAMSRFVNGQGGLSMRSLDKLADLLGLAVTVKKPKRKRKRKGR